MNSRVGDLMGDLTWGVKEGEVDPLWIEPRAGRLGTAVEDPVESTGLVEIAASLVDAGFKKLPPGRDSRFIEERRIFFGMITSSSA
jgi:hypothetical protein